VSQTDGPAAATVVEGGPPRRFGRLRSMVEAEPSHSTGEVESRAGPPSQWVIELAMEPTREVGSPQLAEGGVSTDPDDVKTNGATTFDSAKTFVGPNGTYYDERWRWMEWRGKDHSWSWPAATGFGVWFAYRRLYDWAALSVAWMMGLTYMVLSGTNLRLLAIAHLFVAWIAGRYGNTLYRRRFRRAALVAARAPNGHGERLEILRRAGGVDRLAAWSAVLVIVAGVVAVVWHLQRTVGIQFAW
jgi:hypothetical protein